ncbi:protein ALP1-like [Aphis craccivora]|uniref:Protein ALP1-like n=1 Tax=Aphis craccivora TaxID=307492 RepID=A0A6G0YE78_APHCR|nr:protein ALP1-like [Aphis craccivora]
MQVPNRKQWKSIAQRFKTLWNLPNCIGAIDGKHVRIEKFANSGSFNFKYKPYHSTVLLACCDADGLFTMIETGYTGTPEEIAMEVYSSPQQ